tara:strand:- start:391 stop:627 length:237 start_codon:yes stop_codon:yes gene_type:complete
MARKNKRKKPMQGLRIDVYNNNVEGALKKFKRMVKDSEMMLELNKRSFYKKPSELKREKRNLAKLRQRYKTIKENNPD